MCTQPALHTKPPQVVHVATTSQEKMKPLWTYETAMCLTGVDFSYYQFISIDKKSFIPVMLEPMENR
jgi:hypothetical protein